MMKSFLYVKIAVFALVLLLFVTAIFCRIVDPFWYYRDIDIKGFNSNKTQFHSYERQIKPVIYNDIKPDIAIFSNSFFEIGLNPSNSAMTEGGKFKAYNFGLMASEWDNVFCNVLYGLNNSNLKSVIIGIQPGPLPNVNCNEQLLTMGHVPINILLLSMDALRGSYNTIRHQNKPPTHTYEGMYYYHRNNNNSIEQVFQFYISRYKQLSTAKACFPLPEIKNPSWSYPDKNIDIQGLNILLSLLISRDINVKLIVYPYHAIWMELLMSCGELESRWHYLFEIAKVVNEINKTNNIVQLWDFQGTSYWLTERIQNGRVKYWQDYGHFNYEMGDIMLDVIFRKDNNYTQPMEDEFGVILTPDSIINRFSRFFTMRQKFMQQNPWFVEDFNKFYQH